jgi:hypothetical protein
VLDAPSAERDFTVECGSFALIARVGGCWRQRTPTPKVPQSQRGCANRPRKCTSFKAEYLVDALFCDCLHDVNEGRFGEATAMMHSFPTDGLPLEETLEDAAKKSVTITLTLESALTVGHIEIVDGAVMNASFGGLEGEAAVYAALRSRSLKIRRGGMPKPSSVGGIQLSAAQILAAADQRKA